MLDQRSLLDELSQARDRIEELEQLLGMKVPKPRPFKGMPDIRWNLLCLLVKHKMVTREMAFSALYGGRPEADQPANLLIINTSVSRLNRAIKPIRIKTARHVGYYLEKEDRQKIKSMMGED